MNRIEKLLAEMTLAEKLGQLTMSACGYAVTGPVIAGDSADSIRNGTIGNLLNLVGAGPIHEMQRLAVEESRLRIPLLVGLDILHGHRTLFPIPLAETALFDPSTWERTAREAAAEAAHDGLSLTFAPMIDVSRDPRWGRTAEGPGEDPWVAASLAAAKVRGYQGPDPASDESLAACAKHFCGYGPVTAGREYAAVDISERTLHEVHLPPFQAAVKAGALAMMPAFTDLAGIPMTAHRQLLRVCLRERLGFDGVIISDYNAVGELVRHGIAADLTDAAVLALKAGVDIDMMSDAYRNGLPRALEHGRVALEEIDAAVRRVLILKQRLGLFAEPYGRGSRAEPAEALARRRALARSVGTRAIVMLKNAGETLPLAPGLRRLSVIGPLADAPAQMRGPWPSAADGASCVSVIAGLRAAFPGAEIECLPGVQIEGGDRSGLPSAIASCSGAQAIVLCLGEAANMSGEAASRAHPGLPGRQRELAEAVCAHARSHDIPVIAIVFSGRPLLIPWLVEQADALLAAWFLGCEAGHALAEVLVGQASPSGRTPISWPRAVGQIPVFFGQRPGGRPAHGGDPFTSRYLDEANEPLFPVGHGLTYGRFALENLRVSPPNPTESDTIRIRVDVRNEGTRAAEETVFLFTRDRLASITRPLLELKGVGKITLGPGEHGTVELSLPAVELRFLDADLRPVFEPGEVELLVGPCADRASLLSECIRLSL